MLSNIKDIGLLASRRTADFNEPAALYLEIADRLEAINSEPAISRAAFIRRQIAGEDANDLFDEWHEQWGVPSFTENILAAEDFKRGFLWRFRDHTTSWNDNQAAKKWFLTSPEALFVRRYEFWTCDNGFDECIEVREGSYKEILSSLLNDGDYEVLSSPAFSNIELDRFIAAYQSADGDYTIKEIIKDYIEENPNYIH